MFVNFVDSLTRAKTHSSSNFEHLHGSEFHFTWFYIEKFSFWIFPRFIFLVSTECHVMGKTSKELESQNMKKHGEHGDDTKPILWIFTNIRNVKLITDNMFFHSDVPVGSQNGTWLEWNASKTLTAPDLIDEFFHETKILATSINSIRFSSSWNYSIK